MLFRATNIAVILFVLARAAVAGEYSLPGRVAVLPVAFVPKDEPPPTADQKQLFLKHIELAQERYGEMLDGDTFQIVRKEVQVVAGQRPLDFYRKAPEGGAPHVVSELLAYYAVTRFNCPYVFCILVMNSKDAFPAGGGRPINGGLNSGGGMMYIASYELKRNDHFQCTLQHELGHSFGLPHVDVYGYDMKSNASIMSYNAAHHNKGFEPSPTPGVLVPEDRRGLALNDRVFARTTFDPQRDVPSQYSLAKKIVPLGPMQLPGHPDFYPQIATSSGEEMGSKVGNILREEIKPSTGPGLTYDPGTMWHSNRSLPDGRAILTITFPKPVRLSSIAIHSQHSGMAHETTALRLETTDAGARRSIVERPLKSVDEMVSFPATEAAAWSLTLTGDKDGTVVIRGLRFFDGNEEICPHMVPYRDKPGADLARNDSTKNAPVSPAIKTAVEPVAGKAPVPDVGAQNEARKSIKEMFRAEYGKAKKADARLDLAKRLTTQAGLPAEDAVRYVLLTEAIDLAVAAGNLEFAFGAVKTMAVRFNIDAISMKERAAARINASALTPAEAESLLEKFFELANAAADAQQYALAAKIMQSGVDVFKKPAHKPLREQAVAGSKQFAALRDAFESAKQSRDLLSTEPDNAAANLAWGKFLCFYRQDFAGGLPLVAKGNDKLWAALAERDLAQSKDVNSLLQLGDDWLKAGERAKEPIKSGTSLRACLAWAAALSNAEPALQADVEQKLDPRLVKLFGASYVVTTGDPAGATIPGTERFSPTNSFTIEFWVSTKAAEGTLLSKKHTANDMSVVTRLLGGRLMLNIAIGGERGSGGGPPINDGRWHHMALVKQADDIKLYVDGNNLNSTKETMQLVSESPWKFGCSYLSVPCAARFGGIRISSTVRYTGPFTPQWFHPKDRDTVFPQ